MSEVKAMTKWTVAEVAQASGLSEGAISGYFSNRGITTKNGLNLSQILEVLTARRRNNGALSTEKVRALVKILQAAGIDTPFVYQEEK